jgi:hypothetical protein
MPTHTAAAQHATARDHAARVRCIRPAAHGTLPACDPTCNMRALCSMSCNIQCATCDVRHAAWHLPHAPCTVQDATRERSVRSTRCSRTHRAVLARPTRTLAVSTCERSCPRWTESCARRRYVAARPPRCSRSRLLPAPKRSTRVAARIIAASRLSRARAACRRAGACIPALGDALGLQLRDDFERHDRTAAGKLALGSACALACVARHRHLCPIVLDLSISVGFPGFSYVRDGRAERRR